MTAGILLKFQPKSAGKGRAFPSKRWELETIHEVNPMLRRRETKRNVTYSKSSAES